METISGNLYDFPKYYDLIFGSDWKAEYDFLLACFEKYARRKIRRLFEPACGTGRLLVKFGQAGFRVAGLDLNPRAVDFCNERLKKHGLPQSAFVGDMADFQLPKQVDAAFNPINSFRHLPTEQQAEAHLRCVSDSLATGGLYVLGLHLTPTRGERIEEESWSARRGNLAVMSRMWSIEIDRRKRNERIGMTFDVYTPTRQFRIVDEMQYRTWTAAQMQNLLDRVPEMETVAVHDFTYDIDEPITIGPSTEDVVLVLRKQG